MNRLQTFHEALIPMLVEAVGARSYLELGTGDNQTIGRVRCEKRFGVDERWVQCPGVTQFTMSTEKFLAEHALAHAPYDFVFMDASHSADTLSAEFNILWPLVTPEGLIVIHDTNPESKADTDPGLCGDAWDFARRISEGVSNDSPCHEVVTLPYHPGLSIIRKRVTWGPQS